MFLPDFEHELVVHLQHWPHVVQQTIQTRPGVLPRSTKVQRDGLLSQSAVDVDHRQLQCRGGREAGVISQHNQQPHSVITSTLIKSAADPWHSVLTACRSARALSFLSPLPSPLRYRLLPSNVST